MDAPEHEGRRLQGSAYVDDDGAAPAALLDSLQARAAGRRSYPEVLAVLSDSRVLVPVVAMLGEVEHDERGLARDKSSDMATVLLTGSDGRRALLAFSGVEAMRSWDADARPVPVAAALAAATAVQEGADALLVDVGSPRPFVVEGADLRRLAAGWRPVRLGDGGWAWLEAAPRADPDRDSEPGEEIQ